MGASGAGAEGHGAQVGSRHGAGLGEAPEGGPGGRAASAGLRTSGSEELDSHRDTAPRVNRDGTRHGGQAEVRWSRVGICSPAWGLEAPPSSAVSAYQ